MKQSLLLVIILFLLVLIQGCLSGEALDRKECWSLYGQKCKTYHHTTRTEYSYGRGLIFYGYSTEECTGGDSEKYKSCMNAKGYWCANDKTEWCRSAGYYRDSWYKCTNPGCVDEPMRDTNHAWRTANWGMTPEEVLAAFPNEAVLQDKPESFVGDTNLSSLVVIPNYLFGDVPLKVDFGFNAGLQLLEINMSRSFESRATLQKAYQTVLSRLTAEVGPPDKTGAMFADWRVPGVTTRLYVIDLDKFSLYSVHIWFKATDRP